MKLRRFLGMLFVATGAVAIWVAVNSPSHHGVSGEIASHEPKVIKSPIGHFDGVAELPRVAVDTTMPNTVGYSTLTVCASGCSHTDLNAAIAAASCGTVIQLAHGQTFAAVPYLLKNKTCDDAHWVVIQSDAAARLPVPGIRVLPGDASNMAQLQTRDTTDVFSVEKGANHYRLVGLEIRQDPTSTAIGTLVELSDKAESTLSDYPTHIIIDRCYIHGNETPSSDIHRGVFLGGATQAVIDSHIAAIHYNGVEAQAIWSNGPGPYKISNNHVEGSGMEIFFGGAVTTVPGVVPSDIEITRNYLYKPLEWYANDPGYWGTPVTVKNHLEWKNAQRVLVEGNVLDNVWLQAQAGFAVLFSPRCNQSGLSVNCPTQGDTPQAVVDDITFRYNVVRHAGSGFQINGTDDADTSHTLRSHRLNIHDNVILDVSSARWLGDGRTFQIEVAPAQLTINHNTTFSDQIVELGDVIGPGQPNSQFVDTNNLHDAATYPLFCSSDGFGTSCLNIIAPGPSWTFDHNVYVNIQGSGLTTSQFPSTNQTCGGGTTCFPTNWATASTIDIRNCNGGTYDIGKCALQPGSPYHNAGSDGRDLGADVRTLLTQTVNIVR